MLVYEEGGHFKPHRDTEKADGMFATLIVQFPSDFTGGELVVRHRGAERICDMGAKDQSNKHQFYFAALYADCEHEVRQITSGHRLVLTYSLCWADKKGSPTPAPPPMDSAVALAEALKSFHGPGCLLLEHQYTASCLAKYGLMALKGRDRVWAAALECASWLLERDGAGGLELCIAKATREVVDLPLSAPQSRLCPTLSVLCMLHRL
jgi:hypothetical protein